MSELTDLEVCQKIAEIEGFNQVEIRGDVFVSLGFSCDKRYNPLTDDALCFKLMVKYDINLTSFEPTLKDGSDGYEYHCYKQGAYINASSTLSINKSPNRAICLAIIEANK